MSAMEGLAEGEGKASQIERLIASDVLHGSESLCKLLRYLAEHCVGHPGATVKEYEIATEVFKRSAGFDPRLDATVRVQTGRLRSKLAEYYAQEGANDPWIVEIPRGAYAVTFRERPAAPAPVAEPSDVAVGQSQPFPPGQNARQWLFAMGALLLLLTICVISLVTALVARGGVTQAQAPEPLRAFWRNFVDGPDPA